uniref:Putative tetraspanin similiar to uroplakin 1 n=1 Tax=Schistosoma japonicum TaxID=6182 RepID=C1LJK7_SCHJA|nr:putative tetraspanin similiar to uroplakin 1 [Schistosoma japonicum]
MYYSFTILKFLLFFINFILLVFGIASVAISSWVIVNDEGFIETVQFFWSDNANGLEIFQGTALLRYFGYAVIFIGSVTIPITLVEFCGLANENRRLLQVSAGFMTILIVLEVAGAITMGSLASKWTEDYEHTNKARFMTNYSGAIGTPDFTPIKSYTLKMEIMMINLECCGMNGVNDFKNEQSRWYSEGRKYIDGFSGDLVKIPAACCQYSNKDFIKTGDYQSFNKYLIDENCVKAYPESNTVGCLAKVRENIQMKGLPYIAIPIGISVFQASLVVFSILLIRKIKPFSDDGFY